MPLVQRGFRLLLTGVTLFGVSLSPAAIAAQSAPQIARFPTIEQIPTISIQQLPPEAKRTFSLIQQGGPFPYRQDGIVFGNREGRLPRAVKGYYREYTVPTPGSRDRGARRLVKGSRGEIYYTNNHYQSFFRVRTK